MRGILNKFAAYLAQQKYSKNTIKSYYNALKPLEFVDFSQVKLKDLELYLSSNINTAVVQQAALKSFFGWLYDQKVISLDPAKGLIIHQIKHNPVPIPLQDREKILNAFNKIPLPARVFFEFMITTDLSPIEILSLNVQDIKFENENFLVQELCQKQMSGPLFTTARNKRATYDWAYYWWRKVLKVSHVKHRYTMYQLKYSDLRQSAASC